MARIQDLEVLTEAQAGDALKIFREKGWFATMQREISDAGWDPTPLITVPEPTHVLNVRFQMINRIPLEEYPEQNQWLINRHRYKLYDLPDSQPVETESLQKEIVRRRRASEVPPSILKLIRRGSEPVEVTQHHAMMQIKLREELDREFPDAQIDSEPDFVDVRVQLENEVRLYEIKPDENPRAVIRQALGQLLEYGFHPLPIHPSPVRLIIVGRSPLGRHDKQYLRKLCRDFSLPLEYKQVAV